MGILRLGVTGHRYLDELDKIHAGVEQAVDCLLAACPGGEFRVLSSLAEGADRLLVHRLLQFPSTSLWVPLSLSEEKRMKDSGEPSSRQEFTDLLAKADWVIRLPESRTREQGFLAAGEYILDNVDMLVALWDGEPPQGKGGTAEIVGMARQRLLPLVWIHAGNRLPGTNIPSTLGVDQGKMTTENFPTAGGL